MSRYRTYHQRSWRRRDMILFLERMELYIGAGLSVDRALEIAAQGMKAHQAKTLFSIKDRVESGMLLSRALSQSIGVPATIAGLIEHGEASGELIKALRIGKELLEREDELIKKCTSAMAYPVVIGACALLLTFGLVRGIMPQIIPMLESLHVELPLLTRIVVSLSGWLIRYGFAAFGVGTVLAAVGTFLYRRSEFSRRIVQSCLLCLPIYGRLRTWYSMSVCVRSCGALVDSGVAVSAAFPGCVRTISLVPLRRRLLNVIPSLEQGVSLGSLISLPRIPAYVAPLVTAGEVSGTLGTSLIRAASILDREIEHSLKRLTSLIEPLMMVGMGGVVGSIALSIMMPIYDISRVLQK